MARIVTLLEALKDSLAAELDKTVLRRYVPYLTDKNVQLEDERISVFPGGDSSTLTSRAYDGNTFEVGIEVAQALPESGSQSAIFPDAEFNNLDFLDARLQTVDDIKDLFRDEGTLREEKIGGCYFFDWSQSSPYSQKGLVEHRIFSSIIGLTFTYSGSD